MWKRHKPVLSSRTRREYEFEKKIDRFYNVWIASLIASMLFFVGGLALGYPKSAIALFFVPILGLIIWTIRTTR